MISRKLWLLWLLMSVLLIWSMYVLFVMPDRSDAVAVKVCRDGSLILRDAQGRYWLRRNGLVAYRVENPEKVCAP